MASPEGRWERNGRLPLRLVKADRSFDGLPFFLVSNAHPGRTVELSLRRDREYLRSSGSGADEQEWTVRASGSLGLPTRGDQDVYVAVQELIGNRGGIPDSGELRFSIYELINILRWSSGAGHQFEAVRRSLERIASTTIKSTRAFWSERSRSFISDTFTLWTYHESHYTKGRGGRATEHHLLRLNRWFIENYEDNHLNSLDSEFYWSLKSPTAKRLYRLLESYAIGGERAAAVWEVDAFELKDLVPMGDYSYVSRVNQGLEKAHVELSDKGYLEDLDIVKTGRNEARFRYRVSAGFSRRRTESAIEAAPENQAALEAMRWARIERKTRLEILQKYDVELCHELASLLPHKQDLRSPAAALRWCLDNPIQGRDWLWASAPQDRIRELEPGARESSFSDKVQQTAASETQMPISDLEAAEVWDKVLNNVSEEINSPSLRVWFEGTVPVALSSDKLTLSVPNSSAKKYIESRFGEALEKALQQHLSPTAVLELVVAEGYTDNTAGTNTARTES